MPTATGLATNEEIAAQAKTLSIVGDHALRKFNAAGVARDAAFRLAKTIDDEGLGVLAADGTFQFRTQTDAQVDRLLALGLGPLISLDAMAPGMRRGDIRTRIIQARMRATPEQIDATDALAELEALRAQPEALTDEDRNSRADRKVALLRHVLDGARR